MRSEPIRVVVVEDSPTQRAVIRRSLEAEGDIIVVGEAASAASATAAIAFGSPDVITVDLNIPGGGQAVVERIMRTSPRPILVLTGLTRSPSSKRAMDAAMEAGAAAVLSKPRRWDESAEASLRHRIRMLRSGRHARAIIRPSAADVLPSVAVGEGRTTPGAAAATGGATAAGAATGGATAAGAATGGATAAGAATGGGAMSAGAGRVATSALRRRGSRWTPVVGLAASTGGPAALTHVLRELRGLEAPILVVQHIGSELTNGLATWMERTSGWPVRIAEHGEELEAGTVLIGPAGSHLTVGPGREVVLDDTVDGPHRPSANRLFHSLADNVGSRAVAALFTGMGEDGATGLLAVARAGGVTIAQDAASSTVFGMAKVALELGAVRRTTALTAIAPAIQHAVRTLA